jgi:hypothetical protein
LKSADINIDDLKIKERKFELPPFMDSTYFKKKKIDFDREKVYDIEL